MRPRTVVGRSFRNANHVPTVTPPQFASDMTSSAGFVDNLVDGFGSSSQQADGQVGTLANS
jgi:hypothetical protein